MDLDSADRQIKIVELDHIVIRANNVVELIGFYCDILGCVLERELPDLGLSQLRAGKSLIDIVSVDSQLGKQGGKGPGKEGRNMDHFCLTIECDSEQALINYLESNEVPCGEFVERYGAGGYARSLYLKDPEGNTVELRPT